MCQAHDQGASKGPLNEVHFAFSDLSLRSTTKQQEIQLKGVRGWL